MSWLKLAGCIVASTALSLAGCNGQSQSPETDGGTYREVSTPTGLIAKARPTISDVPVPVGFDLDEGRSRNFAAAGARYVDHVYKGNADKFDVRRFYKRHMPISRWVLVTDMFVQGDIMLDFEKQTERCRIVATKGNLFNPCYVKVQLWTTGRIEPQQTSGGTGSSGK